jgi:hypothetical protein
MDNSVDSNFATVVVPLPGRPLIVIRIKLFLEKKSFMKRISFFFIIFSTSYGGLPDPLEEASL